MNSGGTDILHRYSPFSSFPPLIRPLSNAACKTILYKGVSSVAMSPVVVDTGITLRFPDMSFHSSSTL